MVALVVAGEHTDRMCDILLSTSSVMLVRHNIRHEAAPRCERATSAQSDQLAEHKTYGIWHKVISLAEHKTNGFMRLLLLPRTRVYTNFGGHPFGQRQQAAGQPAQPANPLAQLLHFAPVVMLILFTFFSGSSEPVSVSFLMSVCLDSAIARQDVTSGQWLQHVPPARILAHRRKHHGTMLHRCCCPPRHPAHTYLSVLQRTLSCCTRVRWHLNCAQAVSLDKRGDFAQQYNTARYDVPFFAKPGNEFQRSYPKGSSSRVRLEQVRALTSLC